MTELTARADEQREAHPVQAALQDNEGLLRQLGVDPAAFRGDVALAFRDTPQLNDADAGTILSAVYRCAQLRLKPGAALGHAWIIPFRNKRARRTEAEFVLGYKGMVTLGMRAGLKIQAGIVHQGDHFDWSMGTSTHVDHLPTAPPGKPTTHYWATARHIDTGALWAMVMTRDQVEAHRRQHVSTDLRGAWKDHYDAMGRKTCIRMLWNLLPTDVVTDDIIRASAADETVADSIADADQADRRAVAAARGDSDVQVVETVRDEVVVPDQLDEGLVLNLDEWRHAADLDDEKKWQAWIAGHCDGATGLADLDEAQARTLLDATKARAEGGDA